eukprot:NODE_4723_length_750_cov_7.720706_g4563_i0.p1 GENE.NODE_4723_length_750_cov_7.720706_g4563_i0~~NODE_4723_length_750_cov_7.720706_g4563_i0.p1  ORF type:complete len:219 (-),score=41.87 NODE_4723_length_750_cov_7.720706_g4563_i0:94-750(-)
MYFHLLTACPLFLLVALISCLLSPTLRAHLVYCHWATLPNRWTLRPPKAAVALALKTQDGCTLGAWLYGAKNETTNAVLIYLHGNAGNRGQARRLKYYQRFHTLFNARVLAIDYRGFGESTGRPSEKGLLMDAVAAWHYAQHELQATTIFIWGHSLGSGVAALLASCLTTHLSPLPGVSCPAAPPTPADDECIPPHQTRPPNAQRNPQVESGGYHGGQ